MSYTSPLLLLQLLLPLLPFASPVELASPVSPVKLLLLPLLLPLVSPVELGRRTPPWPHPYWDIPGDYCRYFNIKYTSTWWQLHNYKYTSKQPPYWDIPGDYCRSSIMPNTVCGCLWISIFDLKLTAAYCILNINCRDQIDEIVFSRAKYPAMDCCSGR